MQYNQQDNTPIVTLIFDAEGAKLFADATEKFKGQKILIYMDETMISDPIVNEAITSGEAIISNIRSAEEAVDLSGKINAGSLPFSLISKNHSTISPTVGEGALEVMVRRENRH